MRVRTKSVCRALPRKIHPIFRVAKKLYPPTILLRPAWCRAKKSVVTAKPGRAQVLSGGYSVHLVPGPSLINKLSITKSKAPGNKVKLVILPRG